MKKEIKIALTAVVALVLLFVGINFFKTINTSYHSSFTASRRSYYK